MDEIQESRSFSFTEHDLALARLIGAARVYEGRLRASLDERGELALVVPKDFLPGISRLIGKKLIHADVEAPMLAVPLDVVLS